MPLVTVCIAASDRVDLLLERCLPSVLRQTHQDLEVRIVGDGVDDASVERIATIDDTRVSFRNLAERGPYPPPGMARWQVAGSNAMNAAMSDATGQYVTHIDDDDEMAIDKIERCLEACHGGKADFVHHSFYAQLPNWQWRIIGDGSFGLGKVTTGAVFYDRRFTAIGWDVEAFRRDTPGDWDRFGRIAEQMGPRLRYLDEPLLWHHRENNYAAFVPKPGERFLDEVH